MRSGLNGGQASAVKTQPRLTTGVLVVSPAPGGKDEIKARALRGGEVQHGGQGVREAIGELAQVRHVAGATIGVEQRQGRVRQATAVGHWGCAVDEARRGLAAQGRNALTMNLQAVLASNGACDYEQFSV